MQEAQFSLTIIILFFQSLQLIIEFLKSLRHSKCGICRGCISAEYSRKESEKIINTSPTQTYEDK